MAGAELNKVQQATGADFSGFSSEHPCFRQWVLSQYPIEGKCQFLLQLPTRLESLSLVESLTQTICLQNALEGARVDAIVLSVSEAMNNIIRHACSSFDSSLMIIRAHYLEDGLCICLFDGGCKLPDSINQRYRDHVIEMPATSGSIEDLPVGGWGIGLILQSASAVSYRRAAEVNHLCLTFSLKD